MEDPSLLEESSTLIDPNEPNRGAPLRLGWVCLCVCVCVFSLKGLSFTLPRFPFCALPCTICVCVLNPSVKSPPTRLLRLLKPVRQQRSPNILHHSESSQSPDHSYCSSLPTFLFFFNHWSEYTSKLYSLTAWLDSVLLVVSKEYKLSSKRAHKYTDNTNCPV